MHRARNSSDSRGPVHAVPPSNPGWSLVIQYALCGVAPLTEMERWGSGRWSWTTDEVTCRQCKGALDRAGYAC